MEKLKPKETIIDVGGGTGEYLLKRAKNNPEKDFLILEPTEVTIEDRPSNLHIIRWQSGIESGLPLKECSIDEASINFLMGEIKYNRRDTSKTIEEEIARYGKLIEDLKKVLKTDGTLKIVDIQANISYIKQILEKSGLEIISGPKPLKDKDISRWSAAFSKICEKSDKSKPESELLLLPIVIEAKNTDNRPDRDASAGDS